MNKSCFSPALPEVGFAEGCPEGGSAGGGIATSAGDVSVELEDLLVNPCVNDWSLWSNSVSTCSSWSPTARVCFRSPRARVWCSAASTPGATKGMWLSVLPCFFSPFIDEMWWLAWMPFIRITISFAQFLTAKIPRAILSIIELENTIPNHRHLLLLLLSYESNQSQS